MGIMKGGPVETAFTVYTDFENYDGGIYHYTKGDVAGGHAVKIVGWGVEHGVKYWKVANSWNPYWGEAGYFRIKHGDWGIDDQVIASSPDSKWSSKGHGLPVEADVALGSPSMTASGQCPGSPHWIHAKTTIQAAFTNTCAEVQAEVLARAEGSTTGKWQDPHGGNYTTPSMDGDVWSIEHHTAHGGYTDKIMFTFSASDSGKGCSLYACSESQVVSVL